MGANFLLKIEKPIDTSQAGELNVKVHLSIAMFQEKLTPSGLKL
ncbi:MAG: hypothetical protein N2235_21395 [Fischerella sp.]|nr:hypothetical protein [Fischerella sp.]